MRAFFSRRKDVVNDVNDVDAIDIISDKHSVRVRTSGITIVVRKTNEEMFHENIDLRGGD